jgi:hypothetical protein
MNGLRWEEAKKMDPTERQAFIYVVAQANGNEVDWRTGIITPKKDG